MYTNVVTCSLQKHLGLVLDKQLNFNNHIQSKMTKFYKMIRIIKRLSVNIPCRCTKNEESLKGKLIFLCSV